MRFLLGHPVLTNFSLMIYTFCVHLLPFVSLCYALNYCTKVCAVVWIFVVCIQHSFDAIFLFARLCAFFSLVFLLLSVMFCRERAMTPRYWHAKLGEVELKASYL